MLVLYVYIFATEDLGVIELSLRQDWWSTHSNSSMNQKGTGKRVDFCNSSILVNYVNLKNLVTDRVSFVNLQR